MKRYFLPGLLLLVLLAGIPGAFAALADDQVAYYKSDDSGSFPDATANSYDGTITGATYTASGKINGAYDYESSDSGDYIGLPDFGQPIFDGSFNWTLSTWVKPESTGGDQVIFTPQGQTNAQLRLESGKAVYNEYDGSSHKVTSTTTLATGTWYHIVITHSTLSGLEIFINNNNEATASGTIPLSQTNENAIGSQYGLFRYFDGLIDEIGIWSRALSSTEISDLYNSGNGLQYPYVQNFTISSAAYGSMRILNYNATVNGADYASTDGEITTGLNTSTLANITISATGNDRYISQSWTDWDTSTVLIFNYTALDIEAEDAITSASINDFTTDLEAGGLNRTVSTSTGNVTYYVDVGTYSSYIDADGYVLGNNTQTYAQGHQNLTFSLYGANSVLVKAYNQTSGSLISGSTVTIEYEGTETGSTTTSTGEKYIDSLTIGNYTFTISAAGFDNAQYQINVGNRTFQTLNAYLGADSDTTVVLSLIDRDTGASIEDGTVTIKTSVNGTPIVVSSLSSDITGRVQFAYEAERAYTFIVTHPDYQPKNFTLDPIIFDSYNVRLTKDSPDTDVGDYAGISITWEPDYLTNNATNNISFTFSSPKGNFLLYGYNVTWNGTTTTHTDTNAYGSTVDTTVNVGEASILERMVIDYYYQKSDGELFTYRIFITALDPDTRFTHAQNIGNDYGLGILDRVLIITLVILVLFGIGYVFGGFEVAGVVTLAVMGYFLWIELVPRWAMFISMIMIVMLVTWRSSS